MARRKKRNKARGNPAANRPTAPLKTAAAVKSAPDAQLKDIETKAMAGASESDLEAVDAAAIPEVGATPDEMIKRAAEALALLESQLARNAADEKALQEKIASCELERGEIRTDRAALDKERDALGMRAQGIQEKDAALLAKEEALVLRELDADAGFIQRNREALSKLEEAAADLTGKLSGVPEKVVGLATALDATLEEQLKTSLGEIQTERAELREKEKGFRKERQDIEARQELLDEDREAFDTKVESRVAQISEGKDSEIKSLKDRLDTARADRNRLSKVIVDREEADRLFGNQTPEQVLDQLRGVEKERDQLREALGGRPSAEAAQRLEDLESQRQLWEADRLKLLADLAEVRQDASRKLIAVTDMESVRDEKKSFESANALLLEANRQLRSEVDALVKGAEGKSPFPSCSAMDTDNELQSPQPTTDEIKSLEKFAAFVRNRMASDPDPRKRLYYSSRDVRSFLGGLAMSQLHLLQGISGTGKTSLPLAFARAIGAGSALVEVQAGWRDRQDLIGHFNTFEKRFYESEFLQALYRAKTPRFKDTPFIVILDEMNLSHPEQYFADLLSALEQDQDRRRIVLMTAAVDPPPILLGDGGTKLQLPPNVWFVGTANHDETTKEFADKTYDRAHVMELPRNREAFEPANSQPQPPVSLDALQRAFDRAEKDHRGQAEQAYDFLEKSLGDSLGSRFDIGWGNRLERQMSSFVPVVIATGGSVGEAMDHILATKLLRKIRHRYDTKVEDLVDVRAQLEKKWDKLDRDDGPVRSIELLNQELKRQGHEGE